MKIPTILAGEEIGGGYSGGADAGAFAASAQAGLGVSRGLSDIAGGADNLAGSLAAVAKQKKFQVGSRWVGDSFYQEKNHLNQWAADEENYGKEDYAENFKAYAESRIEQYVAAAPNKEAADAYRQRIQQSISTQYDGALGVSERTRLENSKNSIVSQMGLAAQTFREAAPGTNSLLNLLGDNAEIKERIDVFFPPESSTARSLRGYIDSETAFAIVKLDKQSALSIINDSPDIPEHTKVTMRNNLESMSNSFGVVARDDFNRSREDARALAAKGINYDKIPLDEYKQHFPEEQAIIQKREDDERIQVAQTAYKRMEEVAPLHPDAQRRKLAEYRKNIKTDTDSKVYDFLARQVEENEKLLAADRVSYLLKNNPEVRATREQVSEGNSSISDEMRNSQNNTLLKYQGHPPKNELYPDQYLRLASGDRSLLTLDQHSQYTDLINKGSPGESLDLIKQVLAHYPDQDHQNIVMGELMSGKNPIKEEYRLVWQNKDEFWVENYINSITQSKAMAAIAPDRKAELMATVDNNPDWQKLKRSMIGPGGERAEELAGFKSGIAMFANYFSDTQGTDMKTSVRNSIDNLIKSTAGFAIVNGREIMLPRKGKNGNRTDEEIADVGRRLTMSLRDLDPREIDQSRFTALNMIHPDVNHINRLQTVRDMVTRSGYFAVAGDGNSATLYLKGDKGTPFELHDHKGRAFRIVLDDFPTFGKVYPARVIENPEGGEIAIPEITTKDQPQKTYPLQSMSPGVAWYDRILGAYSEKTTHWPTNNYWKKGAK